MANRSTILTGDDATDLATVLSLESGQSYSLQVKGPAGLYIGDFASAGAANRADSFLIPAGENFTISSIPGEGSTYAFAEGGRRCLIVLNEAD